MAGWDGVAHAVFVVADTVKPTRGRGPRRSTTSVSKSVHGRPANERARAARAVADAVGIDRVVAGVLPAGKVAVVRDLQAGARRVAVVGDG